MDKNNYKHKPGHSLYESLKKTNKEKKTILQGQKNIWKSLILNNESLLKCFEAYVIR